MTDPIQQLLIDARRNQILDAAAAVFAAKGFHKTTIRDIAQHAGIADGTIYNYFDNKTALLLDIFERMRSTVLAEEMPPLPPDIDSRTLIKTFLLHSLTALEDDDFALFRIVLSEMMVDAELRQLYHEKIFEPTLAAADSALQSHAAAHGLKLSPSDIHLLIRAISGTVTGLMVARAMGDEVTKTRWQELPDFLADLILNGLPGLEQPAR